MDGTGEDPADENPQGTGQITELGGNDRTDQRTGTGDGCEMMTEYDVFVRRNVVVTVFKTEAGVTLYWFKVNTLAAMKAP